jgi:hypothetical protein
MIVGYLFFQDTTNLTISKEPDFEADLKSVIESKISWKMTKVALFAK